MTFSVELVNGEQVRSGGHHIEIYVDHENLNSLISRLKLLANKPVGEDLHLMTASWGLGDLSEVAHSPDNVITHHLKFVVAD